LDKTGTITTGTHALVSTTVADGEDEARVLRLAGAVEDASEHPIARAIAAGAREQAGGLPAVRGFRTAEGLGVSGAIDADEVVVGRAALLARSDEHTSELQSRFELVCRPLLVPKKRWLAG